MHTTAHLMERYSIGRSALNHRLSHLRSLGFSLGKTEQQHNYADAEQLQILDDLHEHLRAGRALGEFILPTKAEAIADTAITPQSSTNGHQLERSPDTVQLPSDSRAIAKFVGDLVPALAQALRDPTANDRALLWYSEQAIAISSSKAQELLGVKPYGQEFRRGSWVLSREGKIGREGAWLVSAASHAIAEPLQ